MLNDDYYDETGLQMMLDIPMIPMREVNLDDPRVFLCMGYSHYDFFDTEIIPPKTKGKFLSEDVTVFMDTSGKENVLDYEFVKDKWSEFEKIYNILEDEKSKRVLEAYLNQRISGKLMYLEKEREGNQYFDRSIIDFSKIQNFVDCGAYNGDTYTAFKKVYKEIMGKNFRGTAWLWEAEPNNIERMKEIVSESKQVHIVGKGVGKGKGICYFSGVGTSGSFAGKKNGTPLEVDSIDNIVTGGEGSYIKMDIEGFEYEAIEGAKNMIYAYKPDLAICVYHKRDDLLRIPNLITDIYDGYRFYLRAYSRYSTEIVLYAVAK